jgi:hypothetical protein
LSMMARFVAITPDQLVRVIDKPEMVGGLFAQKHRANRSVTRTAPQIYGVFAALIPAKTAAITSTAANCPPYNSHIGF